MYFQESALKNVPWYLLAFQSMRHLLKDTKQTAAGPVYTRQQYLAALLYTIHIVYNNNSCVQSLSCTLITPFHHDLLSSCNIFEELEPASCREQSGVSFCISFWRTKYEIMKCEDVFIDIQAMAWIMDKMMSETRKIFLRHLVLLVPWYYIVALHLHLSMWYNWLQ